MNPRTLPEEMERLKKAKVMLFEQISQVNEDYNIEEMEQLLKESTEEALLFRAAHEAVYQALKLNDEEKKHLKSQLDSLKKKMF